MTKPSRWLPRLIQSADQTRTYTFDDGEPTERDAEMNTEVIARRIEKANADLSVHFALLRDAENHVVECQGEVEKARLVLEREQAALRFAIEARCLL